MMTGRMATPAETRRVEKAMQTLDMDAVDAQVQEMIKTRFDLLDVAARLKMLREKQGRTVRDIAAQSGIEAGNLSNLENGKVASPRIDTIAKWARALDARIELRIVPEVEQK